MLTNPCMCYWALFVVGGGGGGIESLMIKTLSMIFLILEILECMLICFLISVGVPRDENFVYIDKALFIVYTILSCIGIGFAIVCLIMNFIFKERKYVS